MLNKPVDISDTCARSGRFPQTSSAVVAVFWIPPRPRWAWSISWCSHPWAQTVF